MCVCGGFALINIYNPKLFILSLKNISKGKNAFQNSFLTQHMEKSDLFLRSVCQPGMSGSRLASQANQAPSCLTPPLACPHITLGEALPSAEPPSQQSRCIQRHLEAIWQKEKGAIVRLQLESHNLFFLKHLHSHPHLPVATEN